VLRAAGETETTQENIQDWLELDEGDTGFQLLVLQFLSKGCAVIYFIYFHQYYLYHYIFHCFLCFSSFMALFCFTNPD
jgi:hypothetical protein